MILEESFSPGLEGILERLGIDAGCHHPVLASIEADRVLDVLQMTHLDSVRIAFEDDDGLVH